MATTIENVSRLLRAAGMDDYGDGYLVTDVLQGYAEPGYPRDPDAVIVLGDWNPANVEGQDRWTSKDKRVTLPVRLAEAIERVGGHVKWLDEWSQCGECYRAVRSTADSYSWQPSYALLNDCEIVCHECLVAMGADALTDYIDNFHKCITWCKPAHVESLGFVKWEPGNEHTYESGWHPGQTDTPEPILADIKAQHADAQVVFFLDESSQFYVRFSAYFRIAEAPCQGEHEPAGWAVAYIED